MGCQSIWGYPTAVYQASLTIGNTTPTYSWSERGNVKDPERIINPLNPKNDQLLISPYNISPESNIKVTRIKELITN